MCEGGFGVKMHIENIITIKNQNLWKYKKEEWKIDYFLKIQDNCDINFFV